jgi:hypothetical protein
MDRQVPAISNRVLEKVQRECGLAKTWDDKKDRWCMIMPTTEVVSATKDI